MNKNIETLASIQSPASKQIRWISDWDRYNSIIIWLLLVAYLGVAALLVTVVLPVQFVNRSQSGFFEPQSVIAIGVMGLIGVWLSMRTGFPHAWDPKVTNKQRLFIPFVLGLLLVSLFLATDLITNMSQLQQEQLNIQSNDVPFPASIFVYSSEAVFVEVVCRLFPVPLFLALISIFVGGQGAREVVFWVLAILTSLIEPLTNTAASQFLALLRWVLCSFKPLARIFFKPSSFVDTVSWRRSFYELPFIYRLMSLIPS